jgi:hypothetical protein
MHRQRLQFWPATQMGMSVNEGLARAPCLLPRGQCMATIPNCALFAGKSGRRGNVGSKSSNSTDAWGIISDHHGHIRRVEELSVVRNGYDADLLISPNHDRLVFLCRGGDTSFAEIPDPTADLSNLLGQLFSAYPKQRSYRFLVRGYRDQWLRTVEALRSSKQWDFEQGRPVRGDAQDLILRLADTANSYAELSTAWQGYGYTIHARSIEEIHIAPLNKLPAAVRPPGTFWQRSSAKIPYEYNLVYNVILNSE